MRRRALAVLAEVDIFQGLPPEGLALLAELGRRRTYRPGRRLLRQGEVTAALHVIISGRVRVERAHPGLLSPVVLAELGEGELVGAQGVLDGEPCLSSVVAVEPTVTTELGTAALALIVLRHPSAAGALLPVLSRRVHTAEDLARQLAVDGDERERDQRSEIRG